MPKERELKIITRKEGVRTENPLLRLKDKYYASGVATPELRAEADQLLKAAKKALTVSKRK